MLTARADLVRNRLAQFGKPRAGTVVGKTPVQSVHRRFHNVRRSVEIRLANLQMHDVPALCLQGARLCQNFERRLRTQPRHALG